MSDYAHAQVRSKASHDLSLEESVVVLTNPSSDPLLAYRTSLPVSLINDKIRRGELDVVRILGSDQQQQSSFQSTYRTGLSPADVWFKTSISAGGSKQIIVGSSPYVKDIGAIIDLPQPLDLGLDDWRHKSVVTDLHPGMHTVETDAVFDLFATVTGFGIQAEFMLFPVSSRHLAKTSDGVLHGVVAQKIAGVHRIVHLWSGNGGETWGSEIVDPGAAFIEYYNPSITVDQFDGLHITYSMYDSVFGQFYCLTSRVGALDAGWDDVSGVGGVFNNRFTIGYDASGPFNVGNDIHSHSYVFQQSGPSVIVGIAPFEIDAAGDAGHVSPSPVFDTASLVPVYRTLRVMKYDGMPPSLPIDSILMMDTAAMPASCTRYAAQDGYYIRGGATVGVTGGAIQHRHRWYGSLNGEHASNTSGNGGGYVTHSARIGHDPHTWDTFSDYQPNTPSFYNVVLAHVDAPITVLPQHTLSMWNAYLGLLGSLSGFLSKYSDAGMLHYLKMMVGAAAYSDGGGITSHSATPAWIDTTENGGSHIIQAVGAGIAAYHTHHHRVLYNSISYVSSFPESYSTLIMHSDLDVSLSGFGKDLFYIYKPSGGAWSAPVNLSGIGKYYRQDQSVILVSPAGDRYVAWSAGGINATPTLGAVSYRVKKTVPPSIGGGSGLQISVKSFTEVYAIGTDNNPYKWNGVSWSAVSVGTSFNDISVSSVDGTLWAIKSSDLSLCYWNGAAWVSVGGVCLSVSARSSSEVYVIGSDYHLYLWNGVGFSLFSGALSLLDVSVSFDGSLYVICSSDHATYIWNGAGWTSLGGYCLDLSSRNSIECFVIGSDHKVYRSSLSGWSQYTFDSNQLSRISVSVSGDLFGELLSNSVVFIGPDFWGPLVQVSADNVAESYPSMDIDGVNDVHFAWFDATNMNKVQYRKLSGGVLGAIENVDTTTYCGFPSNLVCDRNNIPHLVYQTWDSLVTYMADMVYSNRAGGAWSAPVAITNKRALSYDQDNGQVYFDNKGNLVINWSGQGWGAYPTKYGLMRRYVTPGGTIVPPVASDPYVVLAENKDIMSPWVFWHQFPLTSGVYHNYPVQGLTTFCLYDVHVDGKTSDMLFFTSDDANVGDAAGLGGGGAGDSDITPGGVSGESVLQKKTYTQSLRSHIGDSSISRSLRNSSFK